MRENRQSVREIEIKENREYVRVGIEEDYPLEVHIMGDAFLDVLFAKDISVSGVGVHVHHRFRGCNIDNEVDLILKLVNEEPFKAKGIIRNKKEIEDSPDKGYFSVEFTDIANQSTSIIDGFVRERLIGNKSI